MAFFNKHGWPSFQSKIQRKTCRPAFPVVQNHEAPLYDNATFLASDEEGVIDTSEAVKVTGTDIVAGLHFVDQEYANKSDTRIQLEGNEGKLVGIYNDAFDNYIELGNWMAKNPLNVVIKMDESSSQQANGIWINPASEETKYYQMQHLLVSQGHR